MGMGASSMKKFQIVYDLNQYSAVLTPIEEEMIRRGWTIVRGTPNEYNTDSEVRGTIACQSGPWVQEKPFFAPSFLTFHGVSIIKRWARYYRDWSYVIVPSRFWENAMNAHAGDGVAEVLGIGWSKADVLINNRRSKGAFRNAICERHGLGQKPIVLFAPTYSRQGSEQLPGTADKVEEVVEALSDCNVLFLPHEMCEHKDRFKEYPLRVAPGYGRKHEYLLGCDLLIGDNSSMVFEAALLDRPIVLLNRTEYPTYLNVAKADESDAFGGELVDVGDIVDDLSDLREVVLENLENPGRWRDRRKYWANRVLGYCDGHSTEKIVDKIEEVVGE